MKKDLLTYSGQHASHCEGYSDRFRLGSTWQALGLEDVSQRAVLLHGSEEAQQGYAGTWRDHPRPQTELTAHFESIPLFA